MLASVPMVILGLTPWAHYLWLGAMALAWSALFLLAIGVIVGGTIQVIRRLIR